MRNRILRLNALIKKEVNQILLRDFDFPDNILVTITRVETSPNLIQTKVYISVILACRSLSFGGEEDQIDRVFTILNGRIYDIQQKINKRLRMRPVPKIKFVKEERTKEAGRIEELLEKIKEEEDNDLKMK